MDKRTLLEILNGVADGSISADDALLKIKTEPFRDLGFAKIDTHRGIRTGTPEIIYGAGKTPEQIVKIAQSMAEDGEPSILITRISPEAAEIVSQTLKITYYEKARIATVGEMPKPNGSGKIVVACAGTSDINVAEEAAVTSEFLGNETVRLYDVGVAGLHRLLAHKDDIMTANAIIAIAGMEGALASVIGGLADCPVLAVPTSVGYGASFGGISALLSMLNSCASGVSVVNIDNGFGAAYQASMINHIGVKK